MNIVRRFFIVMALLSFGVMPSIVGAQTVISTNGTLIRVSTGDGGEGLYLAITTPNSACPIGYVLNGTTNSPQYFMPSTATQYKEVLAIALTAWSLGQTINIRYSGSCNSTGTTLTMVSATLGGP